jgi:hypothetical protein
MKKKTVDDDVQGDAFDRGTSMWAIMRAYKWRSLSIEGLPVSCPEPGPQRFIPVFNTRDQAIKWNNGSAEDVMEVGPCESDQTNDPSTDDDH